MNNLLFNFFLQKYQELHPQPKISNTIKAMPKKQKILTVIFFGVALLYLISVLANWPWLIAILLIALIVVGIILTQSIKENKTPCAIEEYYTKNIIPLRDTLLDYKLYNLGAVDCLIEMCENEVTKETRFEQYIRNSNAILSLFLKYFLIVSAFLFLIQTGIITIENFEPTIESLVSSLITIFVIDYQLGFWVAITISCAVLAFTVIQHCFRSICDEVNNKRRDKIIMLINDLKFLRLDLSSKSTTVNPL